MRAAGVRDAGSPQDWFRDVPIITKILLVSTLFFAGTTSFKLIPGQALVFFWPVIYEKFEIWRFFTSYVFAGGFSFPFVMHLYMLYQNSIRYEASPFNTGARGSAADYLWMLLFSLIPISFLAYVFELPLLSEPLLFLIMYVWSRREPEARSNFFGIQFAGIYLPWVYVALRLLMGVSMVGPLIGISSGY
jgi:hypothetical protein